MQNQRFPWSAIAAVAIVALVSAIILNVDADREGLRTAASSDTDAGDVAPLAPDVARGTSRGHSGNQPTDLAGSIRQDLRVIPPSVQLSPGARVGPRLRHFEETSRLADLPDERGVIDREFLEFEELEEAEESLDLAELEQELFGAERTAVMVARLNAALGKL
jgi:hypothetical protein